MIVSKGTLLARAHAVMATYLLTEGGVTKCNFCDRPASRVSDRIIHASDCVVHKARSVIAMNEEEADGQ